MKKILSLLIILSVSLAIADDIQTFKGKFSKNRQEEVACVVTVIPGSDGSTFQVVTAEAEPQTYSFKGTVSFGSFIAQDKDGKTALVGKIGKDNFRASIVDKDENTLAWIRTGEGGHRRPEAPAAPAAPAAPTAPTTEVQPAQTQQTQPAATAEPVASVEQQVYKGQYIDDDGEVKSLTLTVDFTNKETGAARFTLTRTEADGDVDSSLYEGTMKNGSFSAKEFHHGIELTPDTIKGTVANGTLQGAKYDDGFFKEATFSGKLQGSPSAVQNVVSKGEAIKEAISDPNASFSQVLQKVATALQSGDYTYTGKYIDDDGEVETLTAKVSIAQNGSATFTLTKTEADGDSDVDFYQGTVNGTNFTGSEPNERTPDVIKGTITPKTFKGVYLDDGRKQEGSFEATR
ncbi:hypothetical protein IJS98_05795 [bacterium]|nr:hypothetical protein [bacterium]